MKLLKNKKGLSILVITLALVIAGFLIFDKEGVSENVLGDNQKKGFSLNEDGKKLDVTEGEDLSRFLVSQSSKLNLTEEFSKRMAQSMNIANEGQEGLIGEGNVMVPSGQDFISQSLGAYSDEFSIDDKFVRLEELVVLGDNSAEAIISYFTQLEEIISRYGEENDIVNNLSKFSNNQDAIYITPIIGSFDRAIKEMKKLKVPSDFVLLHKRVIDLHITQKEIFGSMIFSKDDPLRTAIALPLLKETEEDFNNLVNDFAIEMKKHGLAVK